MLQSLELHCRRAVGTMMIRKADFDATARCRRKPRTSSTRPCESPAWKRRSAGGKRTRPDSVQRIVRVSLRSRDEVDVAAVAARFGGGGHARAAGVRAAMPIEKFRDELVKACAEVLNRS